MAQYWLGLYDEEGSASVMDKLAQSELNYPTTFKTATPQGAADFVQQNYGANNPKNKKYVKPVGEALEDGTWQKVKGTDLFPETRPGLNDAEQAKYETIKKLYETTVEQNTARALRMPPPPGKANNAPRE